VKITSIEVVKVNTGVSKRVEGVPWNPIVVMVHTDEGITGFGEIGLAYGNAGDAGFGMAVDFAKLIIGMDPMNNEEIWSKIFRSTFWGMGGGTVVFGGISGIDIALWDIRGKALNVPVYQLLGGKTNTKLRAYASQLQFGWGTESKAMITPDDYAWATQKALDDGYDCVKVDPIGFDLDGNWMKWKTTGLLENKQISTAVDRVRAMREAGGKNMDLIIELHSLTDTNSAIQLGRELEQFNCFYYEEPTMPLNADLMKEIANNVKIPLASGERIYSRWGYRPFFEKRSLSIIQPDLGLVGGITEGKKICDMANVYDIGVQVHICGGPIAKAAALQLEAVIPNFVIHEHHSGALLPHNINSCKYDYQPKDGYYETPCLPGIGQELTEETIKASEKMIIT
jgi:L-alanine-DL-glutamate epimerase-like enolase superfamily enzyme